jgi:hypothetical protein
VPDLRITTDSETSFATIVQALKRAVDSSSLRSVAAEVGMTHRGLGKVLKGSRCQARTLRKLEAWYQNRGRALEASLPVSSSLDALVRMLAAEQGELVNPQVKELLREIYERHGLTPPKEIRG